MTQTGNLILPKVAILFFIFSTVILSAVLNFSATSPDVSWLITICERILAGEIVYLDIYETTPPIPILIYMPAAFVGKILDVEAETINHIIVYLLTFLIIYFSFFKIFERSIRSKLTISLLTSSIILLFLVIPLDTFGQREFFAALFCVPIVCILISHSEKGVWPKRRYIILSSMFAGLAFSIKFPVFAIPGIILFGYYSIHLRSFIWTLRSGLIESFFIGILLTGISIYYFPYFLENIYNLLKEVYVPARSSPLKLIILPEFQAMLIMLVVSLLVGFRFRLPTGFWILFWVATGFLVGVFWQGKYFSYHLYPVVAFFSGAFAIAIARWHAAVENGPSIARWGAVVTSLSTTVIVSCLILIGFSQDYRLLRAPQWAAPLKNETMMGITPDIATSFPLARLIPGSWVGESHSQWIARYARFLLKDPDLSPESRSTLEAYFDQNLNDLIQEIRTKKPSLLIVARDADSEWLLDALLTKDADMLKDYSTFVREEEIVVMRRLE